MSLLCLRLRCPDMLTSCSRCSYGLVVASSQRCESPLIATEVVVAIIVGYKLL